MFQSRSSIVPRRVWLAAWRKRGSTYDEAHAERRRIVVGSATDLGLGLSLDSDDRRAFARARDGSELPAVQWQEQSIRRERHDTACAPGRTCRQLRADLRGFSETCRARWPGIHASRGNILPFEWWIVVGGGHDGRR